MCVGVHTVVHMWRSENTFLRSVLSFHLKVCSRDRTQVVRQCSKHFCLLHRVINANRSFLLYRNELKKRRMLQRQRKRNRADELKVTRRQMSTVSRACAERNLDGPERPSKQNQLLIYILWNSVKKISVSRLSRWATSNCACTNNELLPTQKHK